VNKVLEEGVFCQRCETFLNYEKLAEWECGQCIGECFKTAKIMMVTTDSDK